MNHRTTTTISLFSLSSSYSSLFYFAAIYLLYYSSSHLLTTVFSYIYCPLLLRSIIYFNLLFILLCISMLLWLSFVGCVVVFVDDGGEL